MSRSLRFAPAFTAIAMASAIAGCAAPQFGTRSASSSAGDKNMANIGVATRALAAFNAQDFPTAVKYAEEAVTTSPKVAGFRALLGNAYFGSGRFASAESAFRDSLALNGNQPQVIVKLALVQIAQGKSAEAQRFLASARNMLESADFGLALALAGQPQDAVILLEAAARQVGADARVRQNLALSYALIGDWESARTIAAQDVPGNLVDARIQEWMLFAKPKAASDQVAALTGFRPVSGDPGQPTRLALGTVGTRTAEASPVVQPPVVQTSPPQLAEVVRQPVVEQSAAPQFREAAATPIAPPVPESAVIAAAAAAAPEAPAAYAAMAAFNQRSEMRKQAKAAPVRRASMPRATGNSTSVVQIGAYGSPKRVAAAWNDAARRHASLRAYSPMSARFSSAKGLVYRLSVKGFSDAEQAKDLCVSLRRSGGSCFVRTVAGDAPVRLASR